MLHIPPTNLLLLTAKQETYKKTKNIEEFSGKSSEERARRQKKAQTERVTGLGRRMRGDSKVGLNDSPEIPDRAETSDIPGLPSGAQR